jgi:SPP1 gp7 family putative phage head morphogenesis protein
VARPLNEYEDMAHRLLQAKQLKYEKEVTAILVQALNDIRVQMSKVYEKYAVDGILTKAEMSKYSRLTALEIQIIAIIKPATSKIVSILKRVPPEMYGEAFFAYAWAMDQATEIALKWGVLNRDAVLENLDNPIDRIAVERYKATAPMRARQALQNGLISGQSYTAMMKDFKKGLNILNFEAIRILRTEGQTAQNAGQADTYIKAKAQGVEGRRKFDASLDGRTRPTHGAADGEFENEKGLFKIGSEFAPYPAYAGLSAAERIQCRCRTHFEIEGYEPQLRRTRDEGIIPYQTYSQWQDNRKKWA